MRLLSGVKLAMFNGDAIFLSPKSEMMKSQIEELIFNYTFPAIIMDEAFMPDNISPSKPASASKDAPVR